MEYKLDFKFIYENCKTIGDLKRYVAHLEKLNNIEERVLDEKDSKVL